MKKQWTMWLGIILAGSMLAGCASSPGGAEPLTADSERLNRTETGGASGGGEERPSQAGVSGGGEEQPSQAGASGGGEEQPSQAGASGSGAEPRQMLAEEEQRWDRENDGGYEALRRFSQQLMLENMEKENPLLSPVSAYLALGMVGMGAQGETAQEFQDLMGNQMPAVSQKLMERYPREQEGMTLTIANSAWVDQQLNPDGQWIADMEKIFLGEGYRGILSSQKTTDQINEWCNENTRGLVPKMLEEPLDAEARLAVLDAIYFKGDWNFPFDASDTAMRPFTREDGTRLEVDTMSMYEEDQRCLHSDLGEGVLLPYQGGDFAYVAILPQDGTEVRELYRQLTPEALSELLASESQVLCNLRLPKYEVSFDHELNESLQAMGLVRAFDKDLADFSGLGTTEQGNPLYISLVKQKAVFRVDEKGTEAAAVTLVAMQECAALMEPVPRDLFFDRPFVYMILDLETQVPLFVGMMDDPTA